MAKSSAKKFHWDQEKRGWRKLPAQNGFDVRDAASRRVRRKAANQPGRKRGRGRAGGEHEQEANGLPAISPFYQHAAKAVRLHEGQAEDRSH